MTDTTTEWYLDPEGHRLQDIAEYVTGWLQAYTSEITDLRGVLHDAKPKERGGRPLDWTDVRDAMFTPASFRDDVQRIIVDVEQRWSA